MDAPTEQTVTTTRGADTPGPTDAGRGRLSHSKPFRDWRPRTAQVGRGLDRCHHGGMWQASAWFLLVGALVQLIQSIATWAREYNSDLGNEHRRFEDAWAKRLSNLMARSSLKPDEIQDAWNAHLESVQPAWNQIIRRNNQRYWWNAAGWLAIVIGALLNLSAALSSE